jgi:hypothetical protein
MAGTEKSYRVLSKTGQDFRIINGAVMGEPIDRLGKFEDLGYEPDQLKMIIERYKKHESLFTKA